MKRCFITIMALLCLALAVTTLTSRAWFSSIVEGQVAAMKSGILDVEMKVEEPEKRIGEVFFGEQSWVPGHQRELLLTVTNQGTLPAQLRLGVQAEEDQCCQELGEILEYSLFLVKKNTNGSDYLIGSGPLVNYLVNTEDNWIYSSKLEKIDQSNRYKVYGLTKGGVLEPGAVCRFRVIVGFPLTADSELQGQEFNGQLVLQAAQVDNDAWQSVKN